MGKAEKVLEKTKAEIAVDFAREMVMTSRLHHAITTFALQSELDHSEADRWINANDQNGVGIIYGADLITKSREVKSVMVLKLEEATELVKDKIQKQAESKRREAEAARRRWKRMDGRTGQWNSLSTASTITISPTTAPTTPARSPTQAPENSICRPPLLHDLKDQRVFDIRVLGWKSRAVAEAGRDAQEIFL